MHNIVDNVRVLGERTVAAFHQEKADTQGGLALHARQRVLTMRFSFRLI
jgi:hypothetical protein